MNTYKERLENLINKTGITPYYLSQATGVSQAILLAVLEVMKQSNRVYPQIKRLQITSKLIQIGCYMVKVTCYQIVFLKMLMVIITM